MLSKYEELIKNKINSLKSSVIKITDNNNCNIIKKCENLDNIFTLFKFDNDLTIIDKHNQMTKTIEQNIIKCEIIKEKLTPIQLSKKKLIETKDHKNIQLSKLNDLKTNLSI